MQEPVVEPPQEVRTGSNLVDPGRDSSAPRPFTTIERRLPPLILDSEGQNRVVAPFGYVCVCNDKLGSPLPRRALFIERTSSPHSR